MSRGVWAGSRVQQIVESMTIGAPESTKQIGERLDLDHNVVWNALYQRSLHVKDVQKVRGGFRRLLVRLPCTARVAGPGNMCHLGQSRHFHEWLGSRRPS